MSGAGSGVCLLTNQVRLGFQEGHLEETGAKAERLRQRGEYGAAALGSMMCFGALKHVN